MACRAWNFLKQEFLNNQAREPGSRRNLIPYPHKYRGDGRYDLKESARGSYSSIYGTEIAFMPESSLPPKEPQPTSPDTE